MRRRDEGAETLEFALVFPLFALIIFGLISMLLVVAAYLSLTHGALEGVRLASIPTDPIAGTYPTNAQVAARVKSASPFYSSGGCTTATAGGAQENQPVSVSVSCTYLNPLGNVVAGLGSLLARMTGASAASSSGAGANLTVAVTATARSE